MTVGSNVNPNYPIPGIDQSSKGFRDNFSTIKVEIEDLQSKNIVLQGDVTGNAIIDGGTGEVVINTVVSVANIAAAGPDTAVQFNNIGTLDGSSNLTWNPSQTLVIGPQTPDTYYSLDTGKTKIHTELAVIGDGISSTVTVAATDPNTPVMEITSTTGLSSIALTADYPLFFNIDGNVAAVLSSQGFGVGTSINPPSNRFEVFESVQSNIALIQSTLDNSDNTVRLETTGPNSTIGIALQQTNANYVAGMRISQTGNLTLHTNLNNDAYLDDSSIVVLIDQSGRMGVGITQPEQRLDIDGGVQWNLPNSANVAATSAGVIGVVVDSWDVSVYRSADYTVQVVANTGLVEITKLLVMHDNGAPYQYIYANLSSSGGGTGPTTLGTLIASMTGSTMELIYSGVVNGNTVKVDATYITI